MKAGRIIFFHSQAKKSEKIKFHIPNFIFVRLPQGKLFFFSATKKF